MIGKNQTPSSEQNCGRQNVLRGEEGDFKRYDGDGAPVQTNGVLPSREGKESTRWWSAPAFQFVCKYFLLASAVAMFGWFFETMSFVVLWKPQDRGMLTMPFCYLYGAIVIAIYFTLGTPFAGRMGKLYALLKGKNSSRVRTVGAVALQLVVYFVAVTVVSTLVELVVGLIFMKGLGIPLWSYRNFEHTFLDIICLEFSLLWGGLITVGMCTVWPLFVWLEKKPSPKVRAVAAIVLAVAVVCDFLFNCIFFAVSGMHFDLF